MNTMSPVNRAAILSTLVSAITLLSACVSTEPRLTSPYINLSPTTVFSQQNHSSNTMVDFGVTVSANESDSLENLEVLPGVRVRRVENNSSAAAAELRAGDIILAVNDSNTNNPDTFYALLKNAEADEALSLKVRRDTTVFSTDLVGQTRIEANIEELYRTDPIMSRAGFRTQVLTADGQTFTGAKVVELFANSTLPASGIGIDDTIVTANDYAVESAQGLVNYLMAQEFGDKVTLQVVNTQNTLETVTVQLWDPGRRISRLSFWPLFNYQSNLSPSTTKFSLLKIGPISIFEYERDTTEKSYRLLTLIRFGSGAGELTDESETEQ